MKIDDEENFISRQQGVMLLSTTICLLWYVVYCFCGVGAQVGQESGPPPLLARNGQIIRRRDSSANDYNTVSPKNSNPRFTHSIIISGANIVNLPVPGVGRDHIK